MDDFDINPPACSIYSSLSRVTPDDASKTCFLRLFHFKKSKIIHCKNYKFQKYLGNFLHDGK